jgi:hypothetical protein
MRNLTVPDSGRRLPTVVGTGSPALTGGIFTFGNARFDGSLGVRPIEWP